MPDFNRTPAYNLKAVMKETGLTSDVLHAWERRYELPVPHRSPGGQRLYSPYDIAVLKWLKARQKEGLSISRAVKRWKELVEAGHDPLMESSLPGTIRKASDAVHPSDQIELLRQQWVDACLAFDETSAEQALNQAFGLFPVETVCLEFFQRGLSLIGERWYQGQISVQQEHFASGLAVRRLESLIASAPFPTRPETILTACSPGEWHTLPLLLLTLFLRRQGYALVYLGADVPSERLVETVKFVHPDLVVFGAQRLTTAASLSQIAAQLEQAFFQVGYGGWIFNINPGLRERIPAHFLGDSIESSVGAITLLVEHPIPAPQIASEPKTENEALIVYRQQRAVIEASILSTAINRGLPFDEIQIANSFFGDELIAAIALGDKTALSADIEWARVLMSRSGRPSEWLSIYLSAYLETVYKAIKLEDNLIAPWISSLINDLDLKQETHGPYQKKPRRT